ncbi:hypothetical protein LTR86_007482 [Recurvomyces mirabilis]|nr:hypothetical protein LTR86_007482 [Recurvomyces mirabilis]
MVTTEVVLFPLKAGYKPDNHEIATPVVDYTNETMSAVSGVRGLYSGLQIEDPSLWQLMCIWDKAQSHFDFQASEVYDPFLKKLFSIVDDTRKVSGVHIDFHGDVLKTFEAPVTEIATLYFDGAPPENYYEGAEECCKAWTKAAYGPSDWALGTTYEDVENDGVQGKAVVLCLGWKSKEQHEVFNKTEIVKEYGASLLSSSKNRTVWHVQFKKYQR